MQGRGERAFADSTYATNINPVGTARELDLPE